MIFTVDPWSNAGKDLFKNGTYYYRAATIKISSEVEFHSNSTAKHCKLHFDYYSYGYSSHFG